MKPTTFSGLAWSTKGKVTRRERFLTEMDAVVPWSRLLALIEPHYPKTGQGRPPIGLERMLRVYLLQQWFNLSDPQAEDSLYDIESMRRLLESSCRPIGSQTKRRSCASGICSRSIS